MEVAPRYTTIQQKDFLCINQPEKHRSSLRKLSVSDGPMIEAWKLLFVWSMIWPQELDVERHLEVGQHYMEICMGCNYSLAEVTKRVLQM